MCDKPVMRSILCKHTKGLPLLVLNHLFKDALKHLINCKGYRNKGF